MIRLLELTETYAKPVRSMDWNTMLTPVIVQISRLKPYFNMQNYIFSISHISLIKFIKDVVLSSIPSLKFVKALKPKDCR